MRNDDHMLSLASDWLDLNAIKIHWEVDVGQEPNRNHDERSRWENQEDEIEPENQIAFAPVKLQPHH